MTRDAERVARDAEFVARDAELRAERNDLEKALVRKERELGNARFEHQRQLECTICMDAPRSVALLECGHFILCVTCCEKLLSDAHRLGNLAQCPFCRAVVVATVGDKNHGPLRL